MLTIDAAEDNVVPLSLESTSGMTKATTTFFGPSFFRNDPE
jgi:hypothetical protein